MADLLGLRTGGAVDDKAAASGGGGWPFTHVLTVSTTDPDADYSTIAPAITAAAAGDVILLDAETYSVAVTLNKNVTLKGAAQGETIITSAGAGVTTLTVSTSGARVEDLTVIHSGAGNAVDVSAAIATLERVIAQTIAATGTNKTAIATASATKCTLIDCEATASGASNNYGLFVSGANIAEVQGERYSGASYDIYGDNTGGAIYVANPILANGIVSFLGAVTGRYNRDDAPTNDLFRADSVSTSDFVATINGAPSGATVVYNAPSAGAENTLVPFSTSQIAKMVLHNTTRGTNALILSCNTGTNTITLTDNAPAGWATTDTITIRSQTNTSNPAANVYFVDFEIASIINDLAKYIDIYGFYFDTGVANQRLNFHPYEANVASKQIPIDTQASSIVNGLTLRLPLISKRFCISWKASGAGTAILGCRLRAEGVATP